MAALLAFCFFCALTQDPCELDPGCCGDPCCLDPASCGDDECFYDPYCCGDPCCQDPEYCDFAGGWNGTDWGNETYWWDDWSNETDWNGTDPHEIPQTTPPQTTPPQTTPPPVNRTFNRSVNGSTLPPRTTPPPISTPAPNSTQPPTSQATCVPAFQQPPYDYEWKNTCPESEPFGGYICVPSAFLEQYYSSMLSDAR